MNNSKLFIRGNKKLPKSTLIFNMTSAFNCPSAKLGLCDHADICYAKKAEIQYPHSCVPFRNKQAEYWAGVTAEDFAHEVIGISSRAKKPITALRISEAGDFRSQADIDKLSAIADILANHGILVYCYTARSDLDFSKRSVNLVVSGSGFMVDNNFYIVEPTDVVFGAKCVGDCKKCRMCQGKGRDIAVVKH